jgi:hypothetical protein
MRRVLYGLFVLLLLGLAAWAVATVPRHGVSFHSPIFTADGKRVLAMRRDLDAWVLGPGLDSLTPPAWVYVRRDRFRLVTLDRRTGEESTVTTLPPSPLEGTWMRSHRVHVPWLGQARAALAWKRQAPAWSVAVSARDERSQRTSVIASADRKTEWRTAGATLESADERATLSGRDEVLVVPFAPCAVVLLDGSSRMLRMLTPDACGRDVPALEFATVETYARRDAIERATRLDGLRADFARKARAAGLGDNDAELHAIDQLERLGYLPRPPQLVATPLALDDVRQRQESGTLTPVFAISAEEFRVGLFPDIRGALDAPGREVRYQGPYVLHADFDTSRAINSYLDQGVQAFFVETDAGYAWIRMVPRKEATR